MNSINRYTLFLLMTMVIWGGLTSCQEDDIDGGNPSVSYIRITDPLSSDSLVVGAGQGQMIAIIGNNLQNVKQLMFNDRSANLDPTFISESSVIARVPSKIPTEINNMMTMVFSNGDSLMVPFEVLINAPYVERFKSEYVNDGDIAVIYGDYFYEPLSVTFSGDLEAEVLEIEEDQIMVRVPAGAQQGPIVVTSNFGETESGVHFRDNRNIIASFDGTFNGMWRGTDFVVASDDEISNVDGQFIRVNRGQQAAWPYMEIYGGPQESDTNLETRSIPADAFDNPDGYNLKFELNTLESSVGVTMRLYLGDADGGSFGDARNNIYYTWESNVDTEGEWQTVSIPWVDVYEANQEFPFSSSGYGMYIYFHGPNAAIYNFAMDNFRVVPN